MLKDRINIHGVWIWVQFKHDYGIVKLNQLINWKTNVKEIKKQRKRELIKEKNTYKVMHVKVHVTC